MEYFRFFIFMLSSAGRHGYGCGETGCALYL